MKYQDDNNFLITVKKKAMIQALVAFMFALVLHVFKYILIEKFPYPWLHNLLELTTELVGAALVWLLGLYFWEYITNEEQKQKDEMLVKLIRDNIHDEFLIMNKTTSDVVKKSGIVEFCSNFPIEQYKELLNKSDGEILILQTWIGYFQLIENSLQVASERGCKIRILILDPSSNQCRYRSRSLTEDDDFAEKSIN